MHPYLVMPTIRAAQQTDNEASKLDIYNAANPGRGYIKFQVTSGGIPVEGAKITVSGNIGGNSYITRVLTTDADGKTEDESFPAPDKTMSEAPGGTRPYSVYDAEVSKEGYITTDFSNIPVFDGTVSIQAVNLTPDIGGRNRAVPVEIREDGYQNL